MNESILKARCACGNAIARGTTHCFECVEKRVRKLLIVDGPEKGKVFFLNQDYQLIGRSMKCDIALPYDRDTSRQHGIIQFTADNFHYMIFTEDDKEEIIVRKADGLVNMDNRLEPNGTIELGTTVLKYILE
jgi:hypothetical protein